MQNTLIIVYFLPPLTVSVRESGITLLINHFDLLICQSII